MDATRIKVLPEELCNKIAAGEVVERPSSVVKELVENALDAGASDILVELEAGGKKLIRVTDNGCGMSKQDAFLSLERHATSKIRTDADLFALHTLGFRGEALASIASVARFRLRSCHNDQGLGQEIYAEGGNIKKVAERGMPQGTEVEIRNLFFNLPARRKFLRKEQTELGHAADVVTKQALANPAVSFRLKHNNRMLIDLRREKGLPERLAALLGRSLLKDMLEVDQHAGADLKLSGLISQPQLNRSAPSHIYTFINGRYIRDRVVQHAVMDGYRQLLMKGRYPVVVLFLQLDPGQVDVNVHPTKHEVRFREQSLVHDFIAASLRLTLKPASWLSDSQASSAACGPASTAAGFQRPATPPAQPGAVSPATVAEAVQESSASYHSVSAGVGRGVCQTPNQETVLSPARQGQQELSLTQVEENGFFSSLKILGQYHQSYLLCQDGDDLILIDQHAAHERIGFEKLKKSYLAGAVASQSLLFPEVFELDFRSANALAEQSSALERLGFEIEPFGGNSFALKAIPQLLSDCAAVQLVSDVALELERIGKAGELEKSIDEVLILMACHGVIRANQALTMEEMRSLLRELDQVDFKGNCPHGRPVQRRLTLVEIERLFRRH